MGSTLTVGSTAHQAAVDRLRGSYARIPSGEPVRLAKHTSNLFRPRQAAERPGLDVSGLDGVIDVDPDARTADVQGMCTYETLVDATLAHGLMPYVMPQLRTITLGGAVTGLGIESTSFRHGLPHESVLEMDVLTGAGEIVTCSPEENAELFETFPNSYGSLGYATRLRIALEPVEGQVDLRHVRFEDLGRLAVAVGEIVASRSWAGERVDFLDGTVFTPQRAYLTLGRHASDHQPTSDYTGNAIYYRSIDQRDRDRLTTLDYLWRWDTDWFWCSRAFGAQHPVVRRLWPKRYLRSDVYHHIVGFLDGHGLTPRIDKVRRNGPRERVIQDVEIPVERLAEFLGWFDHRIGMRPVWLCPLRTTRDWPLYPLDAGRTYVNVGFWGTVRVPDDAEPGMLNRAVEQKVLELNGHKSLYSEAFYDRETFDRLYDGPALAKVRDRYDPDGRLTDLYDKVVRKQ